MISRRRILSNSFSNRPALGFQQNSDSDVWYDTNTLFRDHVQEILNKYQQLDDEIWGKIICMERDHRIAKAYARSPVISINNGSHGFDGDSIGLNGFDNPYADSEVTSIKRSLGAGVIIRVDEDGNIHADLAEPRTVILKECQRSVSTEKRYSCTSDDLIIRRGRLKFGSSNKIFDMKKFLRNLNAELSKDDPERFELEDQCFSIIAFGRVQTELLDTPVWIMVINVIALEMVHTNFKLKDPEKWKSVWSSTPVSNPSDYSDDYSGSFYSDVRQTNVGVVERRQRDPERKPLRPEVMNPFKLHPQNSSMSTLLLDRRRHSTFIEWDHLPPPDYQQDDVNDDQNDNQNRNDSDADSHFTQFRQRNSDKSDDRPRGFLNSVLRHLPLETATVRTKRRPVSYCPSSHDESDEIYTHIYSSICESKTGSSSNNSDANNTAGVGKKCQRSTTIPRTLRFFIRK